MTRKCWRIGEQLGHASSVYMGCHGAMDAMCARTCDNAALAKLYKASSRSCLHYTRICLYGLIIAKSVLWQIYRITAANMAALLRCSIAQRLLPGIRQLTTSSALLQEAERLSGTCKWFNSTKGDYGRAFRERAIPSAINSNCSTPPGLLCAATHAPTGFGFITPDDGSNDVFVHQTNIIVENDAFRSLRDGEPVEYALEQVRVGYIARCRYCHNVHTGSGRSLSCSAGDWPRRRQPPGLCPPTSHV